MISLEDRYDTQEALLYWKFIDIKEWCQLKYKMILSRGGKSFRDRKIKCLQALAWWATNMILQGKKIDLNHFKSDVMYEAIEEFRLKLENNRNSKWDCIKPKKFPH